jgi:hypothetical protein
VANIAEEIVMAKATVYYFTFFDMDTGETVRFTEGSKLLGTGTLSGGVAKFATNKLTAGTHHVLATYTGDTLFEPSHGGFPQVVQ